MILIQCGLSCFGRLWTHVSGARNRSPINPINPNTLHDSPIRNPNNTIRYDTISGAIDGYGSDRSTVHVGHHQPDDHHRQGVLRHPHHAQHGGGRESVQQHRHNGEESGWITPLRPFSVLDWYLPSVLYLSR